MSQRETDEMRYVFAIQSNQAFAKVEKKRLLGQILFLYFNIFRICFDFYGKIEVEYVFCGRMLLPI